MWKTSFNGLKVSVEGVYTAYNLSPEELDSLKLTFEKPKVIDSSGIFTVFKLNNEKVLLQLFVHGPWILIELDIRDDLLRLFKSDKINPKDIESLSKKMIDKRIQIEVDYNWRNNTWFIVDRNKFFNTLSNLIAE